MDLFNLLNKSGVVIVENKNQKCYEKMWDAYTLGAKYINNPYRKTLLVMCTNTIKQNYSDWVGEINRTVTHESVHIAQACKSNDGYLTAIGGLGFKDNLEGEAVKLHDSPKLVSSLIKKYCF